MDSTRSDLPATDVTAPAPLPVAEIPLPLLLTNRAAPGSPIVYANPAFSELTGYAAEEIIGQGFQFLQGRGTEPQAARQLREALTQDRPGKIELLTYRKDGSSFLSEVSVSPLHNGERMLIVFVVYDENVGARGRLDRAMQSLAERLQAISRNFPGFVFRLLLKGDGGLSEAVFSPVAQDRAAAWSAGESQLMEQIARKDLPRVLEAFRRCASTLAPLDIRFRMIAHGGAQLYVHFIGEPRRLDGGDVVLDGIGLDETGDQLNRREIVRLVTRDPLTGLLNRSRFTRSLKAMMYRTARRGGCLGLFKLDIRHFEEINSVYGRPVGDLVLRLLGARLQLLAGPDARVARLGGDCFGLLRHFPSAAALQAFAASLLHDAGRPILTETGQITTRAVAGLAVYPDDCTQPAAGQCEPDELMHRAAIALREAKRRPVDAPLRFSRRLDEHAYRRAVLRRSLIESPDYTEFEVHFEPIVDLASGAIVGAESLLRWTHRTLGMVSPAEFIVLAEDTGQIVALGNFVMGQAFRRTARWDSLRFNRPRIAINLSGRQLLSNELLPAIERMLVETGVAPSRLEFELTESTSFFEVPGVLATMRRLREFGFGLVVDDFGTGYSSFQYLKDLPITKIKIDRAFVKNLIAHSIDAKIIHSLVVLAQDLGLTVVAEGIETPQHHELLQQLGCTIGQGYLFSMALRAEDFESLLERAVSLPLADRQPEHPGGSTGRR
jgi:diguanylate cyclase (GGDEF)-like protein/PAS domain S-box-containing protein